MGKKSRLKKEKRMMKASGRMSMWADDDGIHSLVEGDKPSPEQIEEMEKTYRENIRNSPMWGMMVKEYGKAEAEKVLLQCKVKVN